MAHFYDLPSEIYLVIASLLNKKAIYACIRVSRSFYISFISSLWTFLNVRIYEGKGIGIAPIRANAHHVESLSYSSVLTEEYYTVFYPHLHTMRLNTNYKESMAPNYLCVPPQCKAQFAKMHPKIRKLAYHHEDTLPAEFWKIVEQEWSELESLEMTAALDMDAVEPFWRACDRVKSLSLSDRNFPEQIPMLSTLTFRRLRSLTLERYLCHRTRTHKVSLWFLLLLERIKNSEKLGRLAWEIDGVVFPAQMIKDAFIKENCWQELCEFSIGGLPCLDQDLADMLAVLTSKRLTHFELICGELGPQTYNCLRNMYSSTLTNLEIGRCSGVTSAMAQGILEDCVNLITFDAAYIFVRDIVTSKKLWGCLKLETLMIYIAKQDSDEIGWDGLVFEQISKLRQMRNLDFQRDPYLSCLDYDPQPTGIMDLKTLDLRLPLSRQDNMSDSSENNATINNSDIRCWSSLLQLRELSFDGDRQMLGIEELEWMTEHWPTLWFICGEFTGIVSNEDCDRRDRICQEFELMMY